jgi:hypothetical protein
MEKKNTHIAYGLITGLVMVVILLGLYLAGLAFTPGMQYVQYLALLVGLIMNAMAYTKANDGYVTFANVFGSCFKAVMIVALVVTAWSLLSSFIFPEMKEKALEVMREQLSKRQKMSDDQLDTALNFYKKNWNILAIAGPLFNTLFVGAILALIAAAIPRKKGVNPTQVNF